MDWSQKGYLMIAFNKLSIGKHWTPSSTGAGAVQHHHPSSDAELHIWLATQDRP